MKTAWLAASLVFVSAAAFAGDGDLAAPPVAHGRVEQATGGHEAELQCPNPHADPCAAANMPDGRQVCEFGQWVCEAAAPGGCDAEILCSQGTHRQCVDGKNRCVADAPPTCKGDAPSCGSAKTPQCVNGAWSCQAASCDGAPPRCAPGLAARCLSGFGGGWQCFTDGNADGSAGQGSLPTARSDSPGGGSAPTPPSLGGSAGAWQPSAPSQPSGLGTSRQGSGGGN